MLPHITRGSIVCLNGDLGAGKTTFSKLLLKELGYREAVTSPTYNVEHIYELSDGKQVRHIDLYRFQDGDSDYLSDILQCEEYYCTLIEWAQRIPALSKYSDLELQFSIETMSERKIELTSRQQS